MTSPSPLKADNHSAETSGLFHGLTQKAFALSAAAALAAPLLLSAGPALADNINHDIDTLGQTFNRPAAVQMIDAQNGQQSATMATFGDNMTLGHPLVLLIATVSGLAYPAASLYGKIRDRFASSANKLDGYATDAAPGTAGNTPAAMPQVTAKPKSHPQLSWAERH